uniref:hypothetical protein n=1 Tax=unclassified Streptomyces TaxID=2593676 RepID=UPI003F492BFF
MVKRAASLSTDTGRAAPRPSLLHTEEISLRTYFTAVGVPLWSVEETTCATPEAIVTAEFDAADLGYEESFRLINQHFADRRALYLQPCAATECDPARHSLTLLSLEGGAYHVIDTVTGAEATGTVPASRQERSA